MRFYISPSALRDLLAASALLTILSSSGLAEDLLPPAPVDLVDEDPTALDPNCPVVDDPPLTALTADIAPRDDQGDLVPAEDRPQGCWAASGRQIPARFLSGGQGGWDCCSLLRLARFHHHPLYFDDEALERRGVEPLCPALHATLHFACDLTILPARLLVQRPHACVLTPTPHCCSPYGCSR